MSNENYGPLAFLIGKWTSGEGWSGENRAPDPERNVENTNFRQEMSFTPIGDIENHEQVLYALEYKTLAFEQGDDEPFHQEVGYWLWDSVNQQVMKSFIVPRGISVNAGGTCKNEDTSFKVEATLGSETYGICSNKFLDIEFKTVRYDLEIKQMNESTFSYEEDTQMKIKGKIEIFHHTESNILKKC